VILGESKDLNGDDSTTLDELLRRTAVRRPQGIALADPPHRETFTGGPPRQFTYLEADCAVTAIAARLRKLGLQTDTVVGIQLPNVCESVLAFLGVLRAGMIAAPMPLLWRRADASAALSRIGARVIITAARIGETDHCDLAMQVASDVFPIRYVCGFGDGLADGIVPFNDLLNEPSPELPELPPRDGPAAAHVAAVTWDVTPEGAFAVARSHAELIAGAYAPLLEGSMGSGSRILASCALGTFAGLAAQVVPWLLTGGTLCLHHAFDAEAFATQCDEHRCTAAVVPGTMAPALVEAGLLSQDTLKTVLALWRAPERLATTPSWRHPHARLVDLLTFGEVALLASRRDVIGRPDPLPAGDVMAPRGSAGAVLIAEVARSPAGTLALRGPMVPRHAFPPGAERLAAPHLKADFRGFVDTGYSCRHNHDGDTFVVTGPPPGLVTVGGYRFVMSDVEDTVRRAQDEARVTALPDALAGHRLAGIAADLDRTQAALAGSGVNPLLAGAFRETKPRAA